MSAKRTAHVERVAHLLSDWARQMEIAGDEACAWRDAGLWHDAFRDADELLLRTLTQDSSRPVGLLHGPAAAQRLSDEGEQRTDVIEAIRWHTVGADTWSRVGRALYLADFLEPGRAFMQADRAYLASQVPGSFDATFRQVVRLRLEWALREGKGLAPETVALWNSVR